MPEDFIIAEKFIISRRLTIPGEIRLRVQSTEIRSERYGRHEADRANQLDRNAHITADQSDDDFLSCRTLFKVGGGKYARRRRIGRREIIQCPRYQRHAPTGAAVRTTCFSRRVTNSSAAVGCMPMVASNCALVSPALTATAMPWMISGASAPTMCAPTTR